MILTLILVAQRAVFQSTRLIPARPASYRCFASQHVPETHKRSFGQPTPFTHPNIMKKGEGKIYFELWWSCVCFNTPHF